MPSYVDPADFEAAPLMLKRIGADDYAVTVAGRGAGRILAGTGPGMSVIWTWTVTGPYVPPALQPAHGRVESLDEAKAAFRAKFEAWLVWARTIGRPVAWHG